MGRESLRNFAEGNVVEDTRFWGAGFGGDSFIISKKGNMLIFSPI